MHGKNNNFSQFLNTLRGTTTDVFSIVHSPVLDIISIGRIFTIGYLFLPSGMGLAFFWNLRTVAFLLATYELLSIITNKNKKISFIGTICLVFSGVCNWTTVSENILWGEIALVLLDKFMNEQSFKIKALCILGISISIISYIFTFYPPWMISLGYVFLSLAIWILIKNHKNYKFNIKDIGLIFLGIVFVALILIRYYLISADTIKAIISTSYPGDRIETGGGGIAYLFSYIYNFCLPYVQTSDNCAFASIISIFPVPILVAIAYMYKKEKHISFLMPITLVAVFETIFCMSGVPEILAKITLFKLVTVERAAVAVSLACFYIIIYMVSNIKENILGIKGMIRATIILLLVFIFIPVAIELSGKIYTTIFVAILALLTFLFLNNEDNRYKNVLLSSMLILTLIGSVFVNPITKGVSAVTETDIAKKIQEIVKEDENAIWISYNDVNVLANYAMANGAISQNSTNIYPNKEFYSKVLDEEVLESTEEIWNRYAHIEILLSDENNVELLSKDKVILYMTPEKLKELEIKYIITYTEKEEFEKYNIQVEELYSREKVVTEKNDDGKYAIYIYEVL